MNRHQVLEFIALHAEVATAKKRMDELREILLPQLQAGEQSPLDLPFVLVLGKQDRTVKDYFTPLYRLLKRLYGKVRADKRLKQIESTFGCNSVPTLSVGKNAAYAVHLHDTDAA